MKSLQYGVPRIFSTTMRRLPESLSTVCENFPEEGEGRRRNEVAIGKDDSLREWRGKWDEGRGVTRWMVQRLNISQSRLEMTHHQPHFGFGKGKKRGRCNNSPRAIRNAAVTSSSHHMYNSEESHTHGPKDLKKPSCSLTKRHSQSRLSLIASNQAPGPSLSLLLRLLRLLL